MMKSVANLCLFALALGLNSASIHAQGPAGRAPDSRTPGLTGILELVNHEAVIKELALPPETATKLKAFNDELRTELAKVRGGIDAAALRKLPRDEQLKKAKEQLAQQINAGFKVQAAYLPRVKEILSPPQYQRLQQIHWQSNPALALSDPEVVQTLQLKAEQQTKIADLFKEYEEKHQALMPTGPTSADEAQKKMQEIVRNREKQQAAILLVLTTEQLLKFDTLKGKPFDRSKLVGSGATAPTGREPGKRPGGRPSPK